MKRTFYLPFFGLLALLLAWPAHLLVAQDDTEQKDRELTAIIEMEWRAYESQELDTLVTVLDDFVKTTIRIGNQKMDSREELFSRLQEMYQTLQVLSWRVGDVEIRYFGRVAIVGYQWTENGIYNGEPYRIFGEAREVFVRRNKNWVKLADNIKIQS